MYSTDDNFMGRDVYGDLERAYLLPHFAAKLAHAQRLLRERRPGWRMLVCDAARPVSVQRYMYSLVEGTRIRSMWPTAPAEDATTTEWRSM